MFDELDTVVLAHDIKKHNLQEGDVGTVVHCYSYGKAFEVEFVAASGKTLAVLTLTVSDIRPMGTYEILHVREFATV